MTLIECYTSSHIDNIVASLCLRPDKLILVGDADEMNAAVKRYKNLLHKRSAHTEVTVCDVGGKDFVDICGVLDDLIRKAQDCVIDLTGGDTTAVMAAGAVLARQDSQRRYSVQVVKYDREMGALLDCVHDYRKLPYKPVKLTVEELVRLHGGSLLPEDYSLPKEIRAPDMEGLWQLSSASPKAWNTALQYLIEFESECEPGTEINLSLAALRDDIASFDQKEAVVRDLLEQLHNCGIIENRSNDEMLTYTYAAPLYRYCMQKAGNVLEVKTLLEGRGVLENGVPFFHDCRMSVHIDWDGKTETSKQKKAETRNEIDVVLMHGVTPLFISCKNGNIGDDELYKLHTVAQRFGGTHAKKMLIATKLDQKTPSANRFFTQRAWDMDIFLEDNGAELEPQEWKQIFLKAMQ